MQILRTPGAFRWLGGLSVCACYTIIKTDDGADLRIHHLDEGPKDGPIVMLMHGQPFGVVYTAMSYPT